MPDEVPLQHKVKCLIWEPRWLASHVEMCIKQIISKVFCKIHWHFPGHKLKWWLLVHALQVKCDCCFILLKAECYAKAESHGWQNPVSQKSTTSVLRLLHLLPKVRAAVGAVGRASVRSSSVNRGLTPTSGVWCSVFHALLCVVLLFNSPRPLQILFYRLEM